MDIQDQFFQKARLLLSLLEQERHAFISNPQSIESIVDQKNKIAQDLHLFFNRLAPLDRQLLTQNLHAVDLLSLIEKESTINARIAHERLHQLNIKIKMIHDFLADSYDCQGTASSSKGSLFNSQT